MMTFLKPWLGLMKRAGQQGLEDKIPTLGAALAFYGMLSIVPMLVLLLSSFSSFYGGDQARQQVDAMMLKFTGSAQAQYIHDLITTTSQHVQIGSQAALLNLLILFFGASSVFIQLQEGMNLIWKTTRQGTAMMRAVNERFFSFVMVVGVALLMTVSALINSALEVLINLTTGMMPIFAQLAQAGNLFISFIIMAMVFAFAFKFIPNENLTWKDVRLGATVTAFLFSAGQFLIGFYISHTNIVAGFGAAGSLVALMIWAYYSAQIFFFGAEFTHCYAFCFGSHKDTTSKS